MNNNKLPPFKLGTNQKQQVKKNYSKVCPLKNLKEEQNNKNLHINSKKCVDK